MNGTKSACILVEVSPKSARSSHQISSPSGVFKYVVLNQHTCLLTRLGASSHVCKLHRTRNNVCYNCTQLTGMLGTVALDQQSCLFKLHLVNVHVCSTYTRPAAQPSLPHGQQTYLSLRMFDNLALDQHTCLKPSRYICKSFSRPAAQPSYAGSADIFIITHV